MRVHGLGALGLGTDVLSPPTIRVDQSSHRLDKLLGQRYKNGGKGSNKAGWMGGGEKRNWPLAFGGLGSIFWVGADVASGKTDRDRGWA